MILWANTASLLALSLFIIFFIGIAESDHDHHPKKLFSSTIKLTDNSYCASYAKYTNITGTNCQECVSVSGCVWCSSNNCCMLAESTTTLCTKQVCGSNGHDCSTFAGDVYSTDSECPDESSSTLLEIIVGAVLSVCLIGSFAMSFWWCLTRRRNVDSRFAQPIPIPQTMYPASAVPPSSVGQYQMVPVTSTGYAQPQLMQQQYVMGSTLPGVQSNGLTIAYPPNPAYPTQQYVMANGYPPQQVVQAYPAPSPGAPLQVGSQHGYPMYNNPYIAVPSAPVIIAAVSNQQTDIK